MRELAVVWLVAVAVLQAPQPQPSSSGLVVVLDGDAPAADPAGAARLRVGLFERVDPDAVASYFELTADGLVPVPATEAAEARRAVYTVTPPSYDGLTVTFGESVEILRGNEAVRGEVITRACGVGARACGAVVRAAAEAEVKRVETTSARKLAALAAHAETWRGKTVVVVTPGWASRDDRRVDVRRALSRLRAARVTLVIVEPPAREPYRGLVRDAAASLAAQLPARLSPLAEATDVEGIAAWLAPTTVGAAVPAPGMSTVPSPSPTAAAEPDPVRAAPSSAGGAGPPGALDTTLRKAVAYVQRFERTFTSVVWHERYQQEDRHLRRFASSGTVTWVVAARRLLESECVFIWLPGDHTWIAARDVLAVDGARRPPSERWLARLEAQPAVTLPELRDLARENGRFNIGQIARTFNEPTLALLFLDDRVRAGVAFARKGTRRAGRRRLATYAFVERARPTLIKSGVHDVPAAGTVEIDEATGAIVRATVEVAVQEGRLTGRMAVEFRPFAGFDVLVPVEMREDYELDGSEQITATAVYSEFRRFRTGARLILTP